MFDTTQEFKTKIPSSDGVKEVIVRFPSDAQWIEYHHGRKVVEKSLGRKQSETSVVGAESAAAKLFAVISVSHSIDLDVAAMEMVINRLAAVQVTDLEEDAGAYVVTIRFFAGVAKHLVRMPSAIQLKRANQATRVIDLPYGAAEIRVNLDIFSELYDELAKPLDGYAGAVPVLHKHGVLQAAFSEMRGALEGGEDFF